MTTASAVVSAAELGGMQKLYAIDNNTFSSFDAPYTFNNSASIAAGSFTRVGYFFQLGNAGDSSPWVWTSFDTFDTNPLHLGVPRADAFSTTVAKAYVNGDLLHNMHVEAGNGSPVSTFTGDGHDGTLSFWNSNYGNSGHWDWKETGGNMGGGHGAFKIFEFPGATSGIANTLFSVTRNGGTGIGNQGTPGTADTSWTFGTGIGSFTARNLEIWVGNANVPPTLANLNGDSLSYSPGISGAQVIDQGTAGVADDPPPVGANGWNGGNLTVSIPNGGVPADDVLSIKNEGAGAGQIGVAGNVVSYQGTAIGTFAGGTAGANLVLTFNSSATTAAVSALLDNIQYTNANAATPPSTRLVRFLLTDGNGVSSTASDVTINMTVGGAVNTYEWDAGGGADTSWNTAANWTSDTVPDANDIAVFRNVGSGNITIPANTFVGEVDFVGTGSFNLQGGTLNVKKIDQQATASGTNTISSQIAATVLTGSVSGGQLNLANSANSLSIIGGLWTINAGGKIVTTTSGANTGIGKANVDANGGTLEFDAGAPTTTNSLLQQWFNLTGVPRDENFINNMGNGSNGGLLAYSPVKGSNQKSTALTFPDLNSFNNSTAGALSGTSGVQGDDFAFLWTGAFKAPVAGTYTFKVGNTDDEASIYIDSNDNGIFENTASERLSTTIGVGCCGAGTFTSKAFAANETHRMAIGFHEEGGGEDTSFTFQIAGDPTFGSDTPINPGAANQAGIFTSNAFAAGALTNNVRVLANSTIILGASLPGVSLNQLTENAGTTLLVQSTTAGQGLDFGSVSLGGGATINSGGSPNITLRNITETAASSLTFSGNADVILPTANSYTGLTTINSGVTVDVSANNALGTAAAGTVVQSGGSLRLSGSVAYTTAEVLTLNGTGTAASDAALVSLSSNNDFSGPVTLGSAAKIRDISGTFRLLAQVSGGANALELRADNQMQITTGLSGSGTITKTGGDRVVMLGSADAGSTFSGQLNVNEGIWDAEGNNSLGTNAGGTVIANNARLELRNSIMLADNISATGNSGGNGVIRNENGSNTLTGTITLTGASEFFLNDTQLTINSAIAGNQVLTKTGVGTLILKQDNALSNFNLVTGEVRISTVNGLGSTTAITVNNAEALEFDGSLTFNSGTTLQSIVLNSGTLTAISGTTTLDIPITLGIFSSPTFGGAGNLIVQRAFGNGSTAASVPNSLNHFGYHVNNDNVVMNLNNNGGMVNAVPAGSVNLSPTTFSNYFGSSLLTNGPVNQGLRFTQDADFISTGNIGQVDNYSNLFLGILHVTAANAGVWNFRINQQDDPTGIWLDLNKDGIFQSNGVLNSGQNEQLAWNDTGNKTATLAAGDYMIAFTHREGGGGSVIDARFRSPTMGAEAIVNPSDATQAGIWNSFPFAPINNVTKSGTGTVTFNGNNTYDGTTTVTAGTLVVGSNTALGLTSGGTVVKSGGTLAFSGGIAVTGEPLTVNGVGAAGQAGAIANTAGNNSYTGPITAEVTSAGSVTIGSAAGTLTLGGTIDEKLSQIIFAGAGNTVVNSDISGTGVNGPAGVNETIFNGTVSDAQANIEAFRNQPLGASDARGTLLGNLDYSNDAAVSARAAALGAVGFDDGDFSGLWITTFIPNETGVWQFQFANEDDNASIWIDTTGSIGTFEIGDRIYNRGCCAASGAVNTPTLTAGKTYLLGIVMNDTGGGGNFTNMQFKSPTAAGWGGGVFTALNATNFPNAFLTFAANNAVVKNGTGTVTLAGNNTYNGTTTINAGMLVAGSNNALGASSTTVTVPSGASLGLQGGITLSGRPLNLDGLGAAGQPGALVNISGNNSIAVSSPITVKLVSLGQIGIGSTAGTLTIDAAIDLKSSKLVTNGAGNVVVNGVISGTGVDVGGAVPENAGAVTGVFTNVPEANNYVMAYEIANMPNGVNGATAYPYSRNNTATIQPFDRIAYYLELQTASSTLDYVYVSMDAFTTDITKIGIPNGSSLFKWQQKVTNMDVFSNRPATANGAITTGTGIATGNIEIWPSNYGGQNDIGIPNAAGSFDFGDGGADTSLGYGSFQVHNYDIDGSGPGTTGQVLLAYNNWRGNGILGIGSQVGGSGNPDWTFQDNLTTYTVKRMAILVHETTPRLIQTSNALVKQGTGTLTLNGANTFNAGTTVAGGALLVGNSSGSGTGTGTVTVNSGATLGGTGIIGGDVTSAGTVSPGGVTAGNLVGKLTINGNYTSTGTTTFDLASPFGVAWTDYDQIVAGGDV